MHLSPLIINLPWQGVWEATTTIALVRRWSGGHCIPANLKILGKNKRQHPTLSAGCNARCGNFPYSNSFFGGRGHCLGLVYASTALTPIRPSSRTRTCTLVLQCGQVHKVHEAGARRWVCLCDPDSAKKLLDLETVKINNVDICFSSNLITYTSKCHPLNDAFVDKVCA